MFGPDRLEAYERAFYVAQNQRRGAHLDLRVDPLLRADEFDILVILDDDMGHNGLRGMEQAGRRIEVLVKETAVHGLDPRQLAQVEVEALQGGGIGHCASAIAGVLVR